MRDEDFDQLLARLEPFEELGRDEVAERLQDLVDAYRERHKADRAAKSRAKQRDGLLEIARLSGSLDRALADADSSMLRRLHGAGWPLESAPLLDGLPYPSRELEQFRSEFRPQEATLRATLQALREAAGKGAEDTPPDRGYRSEMREEWGHPDLWLAFECVELFRACRPGDTSGTWDGPLIVFAESVRARVPDGSGDSMRKHVNRVIGWLRAVAEAGDPTLDPAARANALKLLQEEERKSSGILAVPGWLRPNP